MTDQLAVQGIAGHGFHGVLERERLEGQRFVVDLLLGVDTRRAATTDDLTDTVDYGVLAVDVRDAVERDPVDLIETLAARICEVCLERDQVEWAEVTVHKPEAPIEGEFADVTLTIRRRRP